jgi:hypothetical protein
LRQREGHHFNVAFGADGLASCPQFDRQPHISGPLKLKKIGTVNQAGSPVTVEFGHDGRGEPIGKIFAIRHYSELTRPADIACFDHEIDALPDEQAGPLRQQDVDPGRFLGKDSGSGCQPAQKRDS